MRLFMFCISLLLSRLSFSADCEQFSISCNISRGIPYIELIDLIMWFCLSILVIGFIFYMFWNIYDAAYFQKPTKRKQKLKEEKHTVFEDHEDIFEDEYLSKHERD